MSEIKGQLLGIVLVVAVFGIVSTALVTAFTNASKSISEQVENVTIPKEGTAASNELILDGELLKF
ncbi:MAG: hypothetical protein WCS51_03935 [Bacilli bacterium]|jgi:hypothetical protein